MGGLGYVEQEILWLVTFCYPPFIFRLFFFPVFLSSVHQLYEIFPDLWSVVLTMEDPVPQMLLPSHTLCL